MSRSCPFSSAAPKPARSVPPRFARSKARAPLLLEIQLLVVLTDLCDAPPNRHRRRPKAAGDDCRGLLPPCRGRRLGSADVFVNVAGGMRIDEPGADLAIALAIASAARGLPLREGWVSFGEIGLTGRLRAAAQSERRLEECAKLGVIAAVAPTATRSRSRISVHEVETLREALGVALERAPGGKSLQIMETSEEKTRFPGISARVVFARRRRS